MTQCSRQLNIKFGNLFFVSYNFYLVLLLLPLLHARLLEKEHALELGETCKLCQGLGLLEQGCRRWHLSRALPLLQGQHLLQGGRHGRPVRCTLAR